MAKTMRDLAVNQPPESNIEKAVYAWSARRTALKDSNYILTTLLDLGPDALAELTREEKEYINRKFRESLDLCRSAIENPKPDRYEKDPKYWGREYSTLPRETEKLLEDDAFAPVLAILDAESKDMLKSLVQLSHESEFGIFELIQKISEEGLENEEILIQNYIERYGHFLDSEKSLSSAIITRFQSEIKEIQQNSDPEHISDYKIRVSNLNEILSEPSNLLKEFCNDEVRQGLLLELERCQTILGKQESDAQELKRKKELSAGLKKDLSAHMLEKDRKKLQKLVQQNERAKEILLRAEEIIAEQPEELKIEAEKTKRYSLDRFKKVSALLSFKNKQNLDQELKEYWNIKNDFSAENQDERINEIENNLQNILNNMETLVTNVEYPPPRLYSLNPANFFTNFKNVCSAINEFLTTTGDASLKKEYERVRKEFDAIKDTGQFSQAQKNTLVKELINLLPSIYHAAANFMINLKASYHQVEGYDNLLAKASKWLWKPRNKLQ